MLRTLHRSPAEWALGEGARFALEAQAAMSELGKIVARDRQSGEKSGQQQIQTRGLEIEGTGLCRSYGRKTECRYRPLPEQT